MTKIGLGRIALVILLCALGACAWLPAGRGHYGHHKLAYEGAPPKLVLQITVDQLRGDLHRRYLHRMSPGGFRYLEREGVVFEDADHAHANTETIVGHATLATGAHPSAHGMIGNAWYERATGRIVYNVEDPRHPLLDDAAGVDADAEIDPARSAGARRSLDVAGQYNRPDIFQLHVDRSTMPPASSCWTAGTAWRRSATPSARPRSWTCWGATPRRSRPRS